jgi:hypothetical protein
MGATSIGGGIPQENSLPVRQCRTSQPIVAPYKLTSRLEIEFVERTQVQIEASGITVPEKTWRFDWRSRKASICVNGSRSPGTSG